MASTQSTVDFLTEQMSGEHIVTSRKMFGEYALYLNGKVVALVCENKLFVKPTAVGRTLLTDIIEAPAYPGAKPYFLISEDLWDDRDFLTRLMTETANELPMPKPKKLKVKRSGTVRKKQT